jgi:hypothetical protein
MAEKQPERIRVLQADGTQMDIRSPRVQRDSVTGLVRVRRSGEAARRDTVRIALTDVAAVETRRLSILRTAALTVVAVPVLFVVVLVAACSNPDDCFAVGGQ